MSFFIEETGLILSHFLYKAALLIALLRWIFACILHYRSRSSLSSGSKSASISSKTIKESLAVTIYRDLAERSSISETCAVCLGTLEDDDEIRELRNCRHVFHRDCIDRWLDYDHEGEEDNHRTCPLCRTPMFVANAASFNHWPVNNQPSWAVERLLYLLGDDLLA